MAKRNEVEVQEEGVLALPKKKYVFFNASTVQGGKSLIMHYIIYGYLKAHGLLPRIIDTDTKHRAMADTFPEATSLDIQEIVDVFDFIAETESPVTIVDCAVGTTQSILNAASTKKKSSVSSFLDFFDILKNDVEATPIWIALLDNDVEKSLRSLEELDEAFSQIAQKIPSFKLDVIMVYNKGHWECDDNSGGIDGLTARYITNPPEVLTNFINKPYFNVIIEEINENITPFAVQLKTANLNDIQGVNVLAKQKIRLARESAKNFYLSINKQLLK